MSLIGSFSKQTAVLERAAADADGNPRYDDEGQPLAGVAETIRVRKEPAAGVKRSATGADVDVETVYMAEAAVGVGDRLDGLAVRRVEDIIDKGGKRLGCEAFV